MCGRYMLTSPVEALRQLFMFEQRPNLMPRYNIAPTQDVPIVRLTRDGTASNLIIVRWGPVPFWADDCRSSLRISFWRWPRGSIPESLPDLRTAA
jgi:putative SOS response-associated peptidase YedK